MKPQKIIFVSHCFLNTASKVFQLPNEEQAAEERIRKDFLLFAIEHDIQIIQLPCPEFTLYGPNRWGHTMEQFNNPFFRSHCRRILAPVVQQMCSYLQPDVQNQFQVLGIIGINGSPSCGVDFTCSAPWGGEFSGREDLPQLFSNVACIPENGIFMRVLKEMLEEKNICLPLVGLDLQDTSSIYRLIQE